jgi:hypothetical protein
MKINNIKNIRRFGIIPGILVLLLYASIVLVGLRFGLYVATAYVIVLLLFESLVHYCISRKKKKVMKVGG